MKVLDVDIFVCDDCLILCDKQSNCISCGKPLVSRRFYAPGGSFVERALDELDSVQLCENTWRQADEAKQEIKEIFFRFSSGANEMACTLSDAIMVVVELLDKGDTQKAREYLANTMKKELLIDVDDKIHNGDDVRLW